MVERAHFLKSIPSYNRDPAFASFPSGSKSPLEEQVFLATILEVRDRKPSVVAKNHSISLFDWYRILRAHRQWTVFQAIRYALWLTR